ncbi:hypothetical protein WD019_19055 [Fictibacillus sp. Mic-4]|uniref:hypothetical protein n=1 Tax=Fictibacillus TaxID=1329200 RepID=UPI0004015997|nr:hypothetical protein [Fictibacillus gelatini]HAJ3957193.1 hypothetical protein [Escherichia coli]
MRKFLKHIPQVCMALVAFVSIFTFNGNSKAFAEETPAQPEETNYLTDGEVLELNIALEKLRQEANEKLANHEEKFTVSEDVSFSDKPITFSFDANDSSYSGQSPVLMSKNKSMVSQAKAATGIKYKAEINNTKGFNFSHKLYGTFTVSSGKIKGATKHVDLTGWMYDKSHITTIDQLDPSVWEVDSVGTFSALKYFKEWKTHIIVKLLGSKDYRITKLSLTS